MYNLKTSNVVEIKKIFKKMFVMGRPTHDTRGLVTCSIASLAIYSRYVNIFVFIDCENNQFIKKLMIFTMKLLIK